MSKKNPLNLSIGDQIRTSYTSVVDYFGNKKVIEKIPNKKVLTITGSKLKCTGTYEDSQAYPTPGDDFDYEPPRLKVDQRIRFYLCKENFDSQEVLVHPDDIYVTPSLNAVIYFRENPLVIITVRGDKTTDEILKTYAEYGGWNVRELTVRYLPNLNWETLGEA